MSEEQKFPSMYMTLFQDGVHEIEVKKSRFICHLKRVVTEDAARDFIADIRQEHWKATHNCSAFIVGIKRQVERSNDDGEPSGTAGVPMLKVLKNCELVNICAIVTRYFGGVKLGVGGLIRAYTRSVAQALLNIGIAKGELKQEISFFVDYSFYGKVQYFLKIHPEYSVKDVLFMDKVEVKVSVSELLMEIFQEEIANILGGKVDFCLGGFSYHEVRMN